MPEKLIPIKGSVPVNKHALIGPAVKTERIEITIRLRRKSEDGLPTLDEFISGTRSAGISVCAWGAGTNAPGRFRAPARAWCNQMKSIGLYCVTGFIREP